jgi:hypothetical protein
MPCILTKNNEIKLEINGKETIEIIQNHRVNNTLLKYE